jgi:hypothetical protein
MGTILNSGGVNGLISSGSSVSYTNGLISLTGGSSVNTTLSNSAGTVLSYANGGLIFQGGNKTTYHILGEDIEFDGYGDTNIAVIISTLNVLGKPFYDQLKKNNICLPSKIEEYLEVKFKILERDRKIKDILNPSK